MNQLACSVNRQGRRIRLFSAREFGCERSTRTPRGSEDGGRGVMGKLTRRVAKKGKKGERGRERIGA